MQNRDLMLKAVIPLALFSLVAAILSFIALEFGESGNTKLRRIAYASFFSIHYFGITLCYLFITAKYGEESSHGIYQEYAKDCHSTYR